MSFGYPQASKPVIFARYTGLVQILWDATDVYRSFYYTDVTNRYRVRAEHAGIVQATAGPGHGACHPTA